ncbi:enoyl-CoA hydratase (3-hydroxybutyryl-CoA dehydratase) [Oceanobacillus iheyensis HTE831]|uniref:3-hydroxyisobutyryl-CoA hydrolase n=1 Tax=Oceanobacillus iheyensis (strain DSM 14371 / CIP 107618 / JCM 11309 / KCTC 3954 / HTE831) TaxID=221109 RepID=Q8ES26_OCEIH|nr:enoyl-CoA hydratase/isomerase family protein [Oceanobacillus iheyensis]BAC12773.1 enoyl-CoA hydratase (3-hydroxybutyryl-CoA dehydratase) [Oceanobacillus iheyensis HTE831]
MEQDVVLFSEKNGIGTIELNRPKAINSLSQRMIELIHQQLTAWKNDSNIKFILFSGNGPKGFCAGGDIKTLYQAKENESKYQQAIQFFQLEYETDALIYHYPKPILAILDGVTMGGGVGLTYGASHRIVTERTKWAMPEMNIGFFPDVGASYFFNQAPGKIGYYLALSASVISGSDAIYANAADHYIKTDTLDTFIHEITEKDWTSETNINQTIDSIVQKFTASPGQSSLENHHSEIDEYFSHSTLEEIITSLESTDSDFANKTKQLLLSKSPISLKVTLEQLRRGKDKSLEACFDMDLILAKNFLKSTDFYEGVRSIVIDKDKKPNYQYKKLDDVKADLVESYFN